MRLAAVEALDLDPWGDAPPERGDLVRGERRAVPCHAGDDLGLLGEPRDHCRERLPRPSTGDDLVAYEADCVAGPEALLLVVASGGCDGADVDLAERIRQTQRVLLGGQRGAVLGGTGEGRLRPAGVDDRDRL